MSAAIIGLVGVGLGFILSILKDAVALFLKKRSNGRYAAVLIINLLDEYAEKCASVVFDDGTSEGRPAGRTEQGEEYLAAQVTMPEAPTFPDDIDWRSIGFKLMYRVLSLPNDARKIDRDIDELGKISFLIDNEEIIVARQQGYAKLGLEAVNLIKELRKEFRLPEKPTKLLDWGWDSEKSFQDNQNKLSEFQKRRQVDAVK